MSKAAAPEIIQLSEHLAVCRGPIHVGIVLNGDSALLIDCCDADWTSLLQPLGVRRITRLLFTHHHRDQAVGVAKLQAASAQITVPDRERPWFDSVSTYWNDPAQRWHLYDYHPHHLMLAESICVDETCRGGDVLEWGLARIEVVSTPGHTDGSVSYLVEVDGRRTLFCGDVIAAPGKMWDLFSLQKGTMTRDYHGFLGAREELMQSLARSAELRPDRLVPSHGEIMDQPDAAINLLGHRLANCYDGYAAISALRHYFPQMFEGYLSGSHVLPIRPALDLPERLVKIGTTWLVISQDGAAFAMDCGAVTVIDEVRRLRDTGRIRSVDALWITHYHDDHVDAVPEFVAEFGCEVIADHAVADVISRPLAWRLPCISPVAVNVDRVPIHGESWDWHEFRLTSFHFPGQTYYHGGLLMDDGRNRLFFVGDSFTMAGIDDYCAGNRNWLGAGVGFDRCLELIDQLQPIHIFNCHVAQPFSFTHEEIRYMRDNLAGRERAYTDLVLWDHANYGMDEFWVRCDPYAQIVDGSASTEIAVIVTNHSMQTTGVRCRANLPQSLGGDSTSWREATVPAKGEAATRLELPLPAPLPNGRHVVTVDVEYGDRVLPQFTEAVLTHQA